MMCCVPVCAGSTWPNSNGCWCMSTALQHSLCKKYCASKRHCCTKRHRRSASSPGQQNTGTDSESAEHEAVAHNARRIHAVVQFPVHTRHTRSEERRVGKE